MLRKKKTWDLIGMSLGLAIIILGLTLMFTLPISTNWDYADYASFGADFYTYQYKATKIVAANTARISSGLEDLSAEISTAFGFLMIAIGALTSLKYGKKFFTENLPEVAEPIQAADSVIETENEPEIAEIAQE